MAMRFEFATASRVLFGSGVFQEIALHAKSFGSCAFVAVDPHVQSLEALVGMLQREGLASVSFHVSGEPTTSMVVEATALARKVGCDLVIGLGGGSVLDTAKVVAALLANAGDLMEYLEVIGQGKPLTHPSAPWIAIPTTAGTGAEVTANSVLSSPEHRVKVSLRSPFIFPRLVAVDPELTYSLPPEVTASSGLDALTQLIEPFVSNKANPITDAFCREGIPRISRSLFCAYENGHDARAREEMSLAALFSGMALANAKLGAVHGIAGPLGGMIPVPHGVACARLLPCVMIINVFALRQRIPESPALTRYGEIACLLTGKTNATIKDGIEHVRKMVVDMRIPTLSEFGLTETLFSDLIENAKRASSMKGNPIELTDEELRHVLELEAKI